MSKSCNAPLTALSNNLFEALSTEYVDKASDLDDDAVFDISYSLEEATTSFNAYAQYADVVSSSFSDCISSVAMSHLIQSSLPMVYFLDFNPMNIVLALCYQSHPTQ